MAVHVKWGRENSLAWVTHLASGKPVAGAEIRVTDSCTGRLLASGTADEAGRLAFPKGLPEPETYSRCEDDPDPMDSDGQDRKSVGSGKSVSERVDLGGRRLLKKKNKKCTYTTRKNK